MPNRHERHCCCNRIRNNPDLELILIDEMIFFIGSIEKHLDLNSRIPNCENEEGKKKWLNHTCNTLRVAHYFYDPSNSNKTAIKEDELYCIDIDLLSIDKIFEKRPGLVLLNFHRYLYF